MVESLFKANVATTQQYLTVDYNVIQNNRAPVTMSIGENVGRAPTSVFVGNNGPTAPTTMYTQPRQIGSNESGGVEVYQDHSYLQNQIIHLLFLKRIIIML